MLFSDPKYEYPRLRLVILVFWMLTYEPRYHPTRKDRVRVHDDVHTCSNKRL